MPPTGTVTFLFTDIEGSTKLAHKFPERLKEILERHNSILKNAIESNNGFIFKTVGDAFYISFENVNDAIIAAVESQKKFLGEDSDEHKLKVRMGIHTGQAEWIGDDYRSYLTLSRVKRIMSAAYGEQILISNDAYELAIEKLNVTNQPARDTLQQSESMIAGGEIRNENINEISFRDLGERRLKDVIEPIRLFQIVSKGLHEDFPPLKTLDARPNNLPVQLTSFIGREAEMKQLKDLLKQTHLLTLTGSGGSGKTRLALQIAADVIDDFANGVWFVELASLFEPILLPQVIMKVFGVKEASKKSLEDTLCDYLKDKELLIILDNCEHLIEACAKLAEKLLSNSSELKIIATSREALRCEGEQTHRVLSLDTPNPKEELSAEKLSQFEAVRLFIERGLTVDSTFRVNNNNAPALAQICYQLDGIPLAIELAAARIKILSVEKIYERLNDRFNLLTEGKRTALPRQQTLKAMIDWSYDLLSEKEKILWSRLSVFTGGWTLEAAEEVCSDGKMKKQEVLELLNELTQKSIIIFEREKERYRILETLKQYGEGKLKDVNEAANFLSKHLHHYMELSEKAVPKLNGSVGQIWLEKLESEHGNLQSSIEWSIRGGDREEGARLAGALGNFWIIRGHYSTGRRLLDSILNNTQGVSRISLAKLLNILGSIVMLLGEYERAQKFHGESLALRREIGEKRGIAISLSSLGSVAYGQENYEQARKLYEECIVLFREMKDKRGVTTTLNNLGNIAFNQGNYEQSQKFFEESLSLLQEMGDKSGIAVSLLTLGNIAHNQGNWEQAQKFYEESLTLSREIGEKRGIAYSLHSLGDVAKGQGNYKKAQKFLKKASH